MTSRKGGYIIIDLTSTTLVDDLSKALGFGKPVLVYNANNEANFYTLSYDDDNDLYILNGAKDSFSVDDDGDITPIVDSLDIYEHLITLSVDEEIEFKISLTSTKATLTINDVFSVERFLTANMKLEGDTIYQSISVHIASDTLTFSGVAKADGEIKTLNNESYSKSMFTFAETSRKI